MCSKLCAKSPTSSTSSSTGMASFSNVAAQPGFSEPEGRENHCQYCLHKSSWLLRAGLRGQIHAVRAMGVTDMCQLTHVWWMLSKGALTLAQLRTHTHARSDAACTIQACIGTLTEEVFAQAQFDRIRMCVRPKCEKCKQKLKSFEMHQYY